MLWIAWIEERIGERTAVVPRDIIASISQQADAAIGAIPGGTLKQYVAPRSVDVASQFCVDLDGDATMIAIDLCTAQVIETFPRGSGGYDVVDGIHSNLILAVAGDRMLETAASLALVLFSRGLYL